MSEEQARQPLTIEEIEAQLGEPITERTFEISELPGRLLRCREVQDATEMVKIQKRCTAFGNLFKYTVDKKTKQMVQNLVEELKPFKGIDSDVAYTCAIVSEMMIEPVITKKKALEWAQTRGKLLAELVLHVKGRMLQSASEGEAAALDDEKNDFGAIS